MTLFGFFTFLNKINFYKIISNESNNNSDNSIVSDEYKKVK